jgi:DNA-binding protein YbaB
MTPPEPNEPRRQFDPRTTPDVNASVEAYLEKWREETQARLEAAQEKSAELHARLRDSSFEATSRDQFATVAVGASGNLLRVSISERARNVSPVQISQAVMSAYRQAARQAVEENTAAVREIAGDKAAEQLIELMPDVDEEEASAR